MTAAIWRGSDEKVTTLCPLCGGKSFDVYTDESNQRMTPSALGPSRTELSPGKILRCRNCRFGFRQLRPSDEQLARLYKQLDTRVYDSEIEGRSRSAVGQLKIVQQYANNTGRLLDIGCASGLFLKCAVDAGWQAEGIEQSHTHCQTARRILDSNVQIHYSTLQGAHLPTASFDVVTLWDVLEHITDPIGFLDLAGSLLRPGGFLFANVPNLDSIQARLLRSKWPLLLPEHLNYFNLDSLKICGARSGLHWIDSRRRAAGFSLGYVFYRLRQHGVPGSSLVFRLVNSVGIRNLTIRVPLGEICGVWKR